MKACLLFVLIIFTSNTFSQNVSPQFSELKGMEDQSDNTHLFYRIYSRFSNDPIYETHNDIYHLDLFTAEDTIFLYDYAHSSPTGTYFLGVNDYEFWQNNPSWYIQCGSGGEIHPIPFILRFDDQFGFFIAPHGTVRNVDISKQNDSLLFAGAWASDFGVNYKSTLNSTDGGFTWLSISDTLVFLSLNPYDDNLMFAHYEYDTSELNDELYRSIDGGINYSLVDTSKRNFQTYIDEFYYDIDETHFYRVYESNYGEKILKVSSSKGSPFSWIEKYASSNKIFVSIDQSFSGTIYLAERKNIYLSTDFGDNFNIYKSLDRKIVGIYKKPSAGGGSNKLYAATKYKIYEITPDTIQTIKNLLIPEEAFAWYPLNLGDKWVYDKTFYVDGDSLNWVSIIEVEANKIFDNNVYAKVLVTDIGLDSLSQTGEHYEYFRTDSSNAKIYKAWFDSDSVLHEELHMDLVAEVGDTIPVGNGIYLESEEPVTIFGLNSRKRTFKHTQTPIQQLELVNGLGKIYEYLWELAGSKIILKGCIIDSVVYGDTTVVSVEDEKTNLPTKFSLSQNYPNPFNPSTTIRFTISELRFTTLKIYDVLGNEISTLVNEELPAGKYEVEFDSHSGEVRNLPSGIYFYQLHAGSFVETKKMILIK